MAGTRVSTIGLLRRASVWLRVKRAQEPRRRVWTRHDRKGVLWGVTIATWGVQPPLPAGRGSYGCGSKIARSGSGSGAPGDEAVLEAEEVEDVAGRVGIALAGVRLAAHKLFWKQRKSKMSSVPTPEDLSQSA